MNKARYYLAFLALLSAYPAAAEYAFPVVEPSAASMEITKLLADARADEATVAIEKNLPPTPQTQFNFDQLTPAFKLLTKNGKADFKDEIMNTKYGQSVQVITNYLHFPHSDNPVNQFVFLRYTFMKVGNGWVMTNFDFKTSGTFPPPGWTN
jgi:hypothetical protein